MDLAGIRKTHMDTILSHSLKGINKHYIRPSEENLKASMEQFTKCMDTEVAETEGKNKKIANQ